MNSDRWLTEDPDEPVITNVAKLFSSMYAWSVASSSSKKLGGVYTAVPRKAEKMSTSGTLDSDNLLLAETRHDQSSSNWARWASRSASVIFFV